MDARMQRLHPTVHHLGHAGDDADVGDGETGFGQSAGSAAGRQELDAVLGKRAGEVDDPRFVVDGDQSAFDREELWPGCFERHLHLSLSSRLVLRLNPRMIRASIP